MAKALVIDKALEYLDVSEMGVAKRREAAEKLSGLMRKIT